MRFSLSRSLCAFVAFQLAAALKNETACTPSFCHGIESTSQDSLCGDPRLGPKQLPSNTSSHWAALLYGYRRLGTHDSDDASDAELCPSAFLKKWYNTTRWGYTPAPFGGFQLSTARVPTLIAADQVLTRGALVDAFGSVYDAVLWPFGTPFALRALPPSSLNTASDDDSDGAPYDYRVYRVAYPFVVKSGPAAAFYGQPGQGTLYRTRTSIDMLVQGGFLRRVKMKEGGN